MKKLLFVFALAIFLIPTAFAVDIDSCQQLTSADTVYELNQSLTGVAPGQSYCLWIDADNVTVNLMGYTIDGTGVSGNDTGIRINNDHNAHVLNGTIQDYLSYGIILNNVENSTFEDLVIDGASTSGRGISTLNDVDNCTFKDLTVRNNYIGIDLNGDTGNHLLDNVNITGDVGSSPYGLYIDAEDNITVTNSNFDDPGDYCIYMIGSLNFVMDNTIVNDCDTHGIGIASLSHDALINNSVFSNSGSGSFQDYGGIFIDSQRLTVLNSNITDQRFHGLYAGNNADYVVIDNCLFEDNGQTGGSIGDGIRFDFASDNLLVKNSQFTNSYDKAFSASVKTNITFENTIFEDTTFDYFTYNYQCDIYDTNTDVTDSDVLSNLTTINDYGARIGCSTGATRWIYLNISYDEGDIPEALVEDGILMYRNESGTWSSSANTNFVDTTNNIVHFNKTMSVSGVNKIAPLIPKYVLGGCKDLDEADAIYTLGANVYGKYGANDECYEVRADNVTLDCLGYVIDGQDPASTVNAIFVDGYDEFELKNCDIYNYTRGIWLQDSLDSHIHQNDFHDMGAPGGQRGIYVRDESNGTIVEDNTIYDINAQGIYLDLDANEIVIDDNDIYDVDYGIFFAGTSLLNNNVTNNRVNNCDTGLWFSNVDQAYVYNNDFVDNLNYGIYLNGADDNTFETNNVTGNGVAGIYSQSATTGNTFEDIDFLEVNADFIINGQVSLIDGSSPGADPSGYTNINKYLEAQAVGSPWLQLNISYNDRSPTNESALEMWKHNGSWYAVPGSGVNTASDYVYANITSFSTFAILENTGFDCYDITTPGTHLLGGPVSGNQSDGYCIEIDSDDVIFDCQNYLINGTGATGSAGIYVSTQDNVTIKNCDVRNYVYGIYPYTSDDAVIFDNDVIDNSYGIVIHSSDDYNVSNNDVNSNIHGIWALDAESGNIGHNNVTVSTGTGILLDAISANSPTVEYNDVINQQIGINLDNAEDAIIRHNFINTTVQAGILIDSSDGGYFFNNSIYGSSLQGIYADSSNNFTIEQNNIINNPGDGIRYDNVDDTNITNNFINNSGANGIDLNSASVDNIIRDNRIYESTNAQMVINFNSLRNQIINNTVDSGTTTGIYSTGASDDCIFEDNKLTNNGGNGIWLRAADDSLVTNNLFENNTGAGLYIHENGQRNNATFNTFNDGSGTQTTGINVATGNDFIKVMHNTINAGHSTRGIIYNQNNDGYVYNNTLIDVTGIGIYMNNADSSLVEDNTITRAATRGIYLDTNADSTNITGNTITNTSIGIRLESSDLALVNLNVIDGATAEGIYVNGTSNNNDFEYNNITGANQGIEVFSNAEYNTFTNNRIVDTTTYGIRINQGDNNTFTDMYILNSGTEDIYSDDTADLALDNVFNDLLLDDTEVSFTYRGEIEMSYATSPASDPVDYTNVGEYVDLENNTNAWVFLNISYNPAIPVYETNLKMLRYNGTVWSNATNMGVNTAQNYVYANITEFSIFAPMELNTSSEIPVTTVAQIVGNTYNDSNKTGWCTGVDENNATINFYYIFYKNDANFANGLYTGASNNTATSVYTIDSNDIATGDTLIISCLASDGEYNGTWLNSSTMTVTGETPVPPTPNEIAQQGMSALEFFMDWGYIILILVALGFIITALATRKLNGRWLMNGIIIVVTLLMIIAFAVMMLSLM